MAVVWKKLAFEDDCLLEADFAAKGDLLSASANDTLEILSVGTNGYVLTAASGETSGLVWATPAAPGAHKDSHDPGGTDPLDSAAPAELAGIQGSGAGSAETWAKSDHAHQIQESMADNHLVTVNQADVATDDYARFTATGGLSGLTAAEVAATIALDDVGVPDAGVDFDLQEATDLVVMTVADAAAKDALAAAATEVGQLLWVTTPGALYICITSAV